MDKLERIEEVVNRTLELIGNDSFTAGAKAVAEMIDLILKDKKADTKSAK